MTMDISKVTWKGKPVDDLTPEETRRALIDALAMIEHMRKADKEQSEDNWLMGIRERRKRIIGW